MTSKASRAAPTSSGGTRALNGTPLLPQSGQREFAAEVSWDLPSLAPGATTLIDVTVSGARAGDLTEASLVSSTRFIELDAAVWSNNMVRMMTRNISGTTFDLAAATRTWVLTSDDWYNSSGTLNSQSDDARRRMPPPNCQLLIQTHRAQPKHIAHNANRG